MATEQSSSLVAILDDDESIRDALLDLVESERLPAVCFGSAEEFLYSRAGREASCLIADIRMPGISGLELQATLKSERCPVPIIFITGLGDIPMAVRAMREGAIDFLTKPVDDATLLKSVERAFQQYRENRRDAVEHESFATRYKTLTPRERQVLSLLVRGLLNKQVGFELGITEYTVQIHRAHIMQKMEADSFATLIKLVAKFASEPPGSGGTVETGGSEALDCCRSKGAAETGNTRHRTRGVVGSGPGPYRSL
jgi:FixJ family two-component response regulator